MTVIVSLLWGHSLTFQTCDKETKTRKLFLLSHSRFYLINGKRVLTIVKFLLGGYEKKKKKKEEGKEENVIMKHGTAGLLGIITFEKAHALIPAVIFH